MKKYMHHFVIAFFLLVLHVKLPSNVLAQHDNIAAKIQGVERLPVKKLLNDKWYVIQVSPGKRSGHGTTPGLYRTPDGSFQSDGTTGPRSTLVIGYWKVEYRSSNSKDMFDGGRYHWWKQTSIKDMRTGVTYSPFISGGTVLSWGNIKQKYKLPKWRRAKNIRAQEKSNLKEISLPSEIAQEKTVYTKQNFDPYFLLPEEWAKKVVDTTRVLREKTDLFRGDISKEDISNIDNPILSSKLFQHFVRQDPFSFHDCVRLIPNKSNFLAVFFTHALFKRSFNLEGKKKHILKYIETADRKTDVINSTYAFYALLENNRNLLFKTKEEARITKNVIEELISKRKSIKINNTDYQEIITSLEKRFPNLASEGSNDDKQ